MASIQLEEITIGQIHAAYKEGRVTAEALTAAFLDRIQKIDKDDDGPKLNSTLAINGAALEEARRLDASFANDGRFVGPLHGIPVVVKDHLKMKGMPNTYGSIVAKDYIPDEDATAVAKLKSAGAIILAKTTMPDWGTDWFSNSSLSGTTRNPYDLERDPGGSSGGTATALAANLAVVGLGSDTGGSSRVPAAFCSLVGFRPTAGLISGYGGLRAVHGQSTVGPMARTVTDLALLLDAVAGYDENDSRVGVIRAMFGDDTIPEQRQVNEVIQAALDTLADSGVTLVDIEVPNLANYIAGSSVLLTRSRIDLEGFIKDNFSVDFSSLLANGQLPKENVLSGEYGKQLDTRVEFDAVLSALMIKHQVSAFAFPEAKIPPPVSADIDAKMRLAVPANFAIASNLRWPAVSVPAGFTSNGQPVGLELLSLPLKDQELLNLAHRVEQAVQGRKPPTNI
uniref:Amidase domain-containing protein n=1 Tax=Bionectria ochroleuca TaxID=29856 RepID=A0A8H7TWG2_BIOOC